MPKTINCKLRALGKEYVSAEILKYRNTAKHKTAAAKSASVLPWHKINDPQCVG